MRASRNPLLDLESEAGFSDTGFSGQKNDPTATFRDHLVPMSDELPQLRASGDKPEQSGLLGKPAFEDS